MHHAPLTSEVSLGLKIFPVLFGLGFGSAAAGYHLLSLLKPGEHKANVKFEIWFRIW